MICLNRLEITGLLEPGIPRCVLQEVLDCHGIAYKSNELELFSYVGGLIQEIEKTYVPVIPDPRQDSASLSDTQWKYLARYVNPSRTWSWDSDALVKAFTFLHTFTRECLAPSNPSFYIGAQSPVCLEAYNACILYRICKNNHFVLTAETTIEQMGQIVRLLCLSRQEVCRLLEDRLSHYDRYSLINLLRLDDKFQSLPVNCSSENQRNTITFQDLSNYAEQFRSVEQLRKYIEPKIPAEAVALAALNYGIDISEATDPVAEYNLLNSLSESEQQNYIPRDPLLKQIKQSRPQALSIVWYFNPIFPVSYYTEEAIRLMVRNEGFTSEDLQDSTGYELLQLAYLRNTFYPGKWLEITNKETPIYNEDVAQLSPELVLSYGTQRGTMTAIRYAELADSFLYNRNFRNPLTKDECFDDISIRKLKYLASLPCSEAAKTERKRLLKAILETELFTVQANSKALELYKAYVAAEPDVKEQIEACLKALLDLGMACRGWLGSGAYPLRNSPVTNQNQVDVQVTQRLHKWDQSVRDLGELSDLLEELPLMAYRGQFYACTDKTKGLTIGERIEILRQGDENDNIESCMRLSSNWLCASAHRYYTVIGLDAPFDIEQLRNIS